MCLTKASIYFKMKEEMKDVGDEAPSMKTFYRLWRENMPNVSIPKVLLFSFINLHTVISKDAKPL